MISKINQLCLNGCHGNKKLSQYLPYYKVIPETKINDFRKLKLTTSDTLAGHES
jgi:hypothetical protein